MVGAIWLAVGLCGAFNREGWVWFVAFFATIATGIIMTHPL